MKYFMPLIFLAACGDGSRMSERPNRAIKAVLLVDPRAQCHSNALALEGTPAPDNAYCLTGNVILWCTADAANPLQCARVGERPTKKAEKEETK